MLLSIDLGSYSPIVLPGILSLVLAYLLGSINFSIILTRILTHDDIRNHGSGNAGMTNVLRTIGKWPAVFTFILDFAKCAAAVVIARAILSPVVESHGLSPDVANVAGYFAGYACILGHMFPIYFGFRGGKGVVTSIAMIFFIDWRCGLVVLGTFLITLAVKKIISLGSIFGAISYPISTFVFTFFFDCSMSPLASHGDEGALYLTAVTVLSLLIAGTVIGKHHANIGRLLNGTEQPIHAKK